MLQLDGVTAFYGAIQALKGVDLHVDPGEIVTLIGANGAGKSTLMKAVMGLLRTHAGQIRFDGRLFGSLRPDKRARLGVGYCPEGRRTFPGLQVRENLLVACWEGAAERARRVEDVFALFPALRAKAVEFVKTGAEIYHRQ